MELVPGQQILWERVRSTTPYKAELIAAQVAHVSKERVYIKIPIPGGFIQKSVKAKYVRAMGTVLPEAVSSRQKRAHKGRWG